MASKGTLSKETEYRQLFQHLRKRAVAIGLTDDDLLKYGLVDDLKAPRRPIGVIFAGIIIVCTLLILTMVGLFLIQWPVSRQTMLRVYADRVHDADLEELDCIIPHTEAILDFVRPPADCSMCRYLTAIDRVTNLTPDEFEKKYAYTRRPVVIEDGQKDWTAANTFTFEFFKNVYANDSPALDNENPDCQFFPYKTNFETLREVFNMSDDRAHLKDGSDPWYIGWSNCDGAAAEALRKHYKRPYFIPEVAESSRTDWIFMGSPGHGAHMHIDNVMNPSWQAQIAGRKMWILEPPSECYFECKGASHMETVLEPGDIIVVDTNVWVHGTKVLGNDISICIGSEYD